MNAIAVPSSPALLTAEQFCEQYAEYRYELVDGIPVEAPMPGGKHGSIVGLLVFYLTQFALARNLGHVMTCDTFVVTKRGADTVRGADVLFASYARIPKDAVPEGPLTVAPELVFEVRSPTDRWVSLMAKVTEYLEAGVTAVSVIDPKLETLTVYRADVDPRTLGKNDTFALPDVLPGFEMPIAAIFA